MLVNSFLVAILGFFSCSKTVTENIVEPSAEPTKVKPDERPVIYGVPPAIQTQDSISEKAKKDTVLREEPKVNGEMRVLYGPPPVIKK